MARKVLIMGAAGRDFHNFNVFFRNNPKYEVVAFTAAQIPDIDDRIYPKELTGELYPNGILIYPEEEVVNLIKQLQVDEVVFAYSDVQHEYVMHKASIALAAGADYRLMGPKATMLKSAKPIVAVTAVRTGSGKSQTTRKVCDTLKAMGKKVVAVRHPMPYGDLTKQICQRYATYADLDRYECTIEEREEFEPHLDRGVVVYAGIDYDKILREAEKEADVVVWDGGNNDLPFFAPDIHITVVDPHRPGHELAYHPGETNFRLADVLIINKMETAPPEGIDIIRRNIEAINPNAVVIEAASPIFVEDPQKIKGKRVLVIEDGPTLTHGEMTYGAGIIAAKKYGAAEIIDPRAYTVDSIRETYRKYPNIGILLPAMGYGAKQVSDLQDTINSVDCDTVIIATPIDLSRIARITKPTVRVKYELQEIGTPNLFDVLGKL